MPHTTASVFLEASEDADLDRSMSELLEHAEGKRGFTFATSVVATAVTLRIEIQHSHTLFLTVDPNTGCAFTGELLVEHNGKSKSCLVAPDTLSVIEGRFRPVIEKGLQALAEQMESTKTTP